MCINSSTTIAATSTNQRKATLLQLSWILIDRTHCFKHQYHNQRYVTYRLTLLKGYISKATTLTSTRIFSISELVMDYGLCMSHRSSFLAGANSSRDVADAYPQGKTLRLKRLTCCSYQSSHSYRPRRRFVPTTSIMGSPKLLLRSRRRPTRLDLDRTIRLHPFTNNAGLIRSRRMENSL